MRNRPIEIATVIIFTIGCFTSCALGSKATLPGLENADNISNVRHTKLPVFMAKPIIKSAMNDDEGKAVYHAVIKKVRSFDLFTGEVKNNDLMPELKTLALRQNVEEWASVHHNKTYLFFGVREKKDLLRRITFVSYAAGGKFVYLDVKCKIRPADLAELFKEGLNKEMISKLIPLNGGGTGGN